MCYFWENQPEKGNEMEINNLGVRRFHGEVEMKKEMGKGMNQDEEMEGEVTIGTGDGDSEDWEEREGKQGVDERENATGDVGETIDDKNLPSVDDVCPICFDTFTIPCRSNCGHWFCATCILQFWMFRSSIQPCKCPLCCCRIVNLEPRVAQMISGADDSIEVLKKVHQYNGLYITGVSGAFHLILAVERRVQGSQGIATYHVKNYLSSNFQSAVLSFSGRKKMWRILY